MDQLVIHQADKLKRGGGAENKWLDILKCVTVVWLRPLTQTMGQGEKKSGYKTPKSRLTNGH